MNREHFVEVLKSTEWDIVVIGGGATGLGVALDAVTRGLKVALIEKNDYAAGATSTSTKLIHGGVRYLEKAIKEFDLGQYKLVHEALHERKTMLQIAPHLSQPIPFIIPVYSNFQKWYYFVGIRIYDFIAGKDKIPNASILSRSDAITQFPKLEASKIHSAILYYDGQFNDAFYATALMRTAVQHGAYCLNYFELIHADFDQEQKIYSLIVQDNFSNEQYKLKSKLLVNCAGVQADKIRKMVYPELENRLRPSKGVHIVLPREWLSSNHALLIPSTEDGRVIFVIPWYYCVIIGTTDTEIQDLNSEPVVTESDIDYLLRQVNPYLSQPIQKNDIIGSFAGYRPLVKANKSRKEALIRNHEIEVFKEKNFISVLGGKWTTYRKMAEDAVNEIFKILNLPLVRCKTQNLKLVGASTQKFPNALHLPEFIHHHLHYYGSEYPILLEYIRKYGADLIVENYPFTIGEAMFLKENAQIFTVEDLLYRGTRLGNIDFQAAQKAKQFVLSNPLKLNFFE